MVSRSSSFSISTVCEGEGSERKISTGVSGGSSLGRIRLGPLALFHLRLQPDHGGFQ